MAATIIVSCPKCNRGFQAPASLQGKRIKCKACGEVFPVAGKVHEEEEWGSIKAYGVNVVKDVPHCPHCAHELEETDVVCLHCGYNLQTRERHEPKVVQPVDAMDYFIHLLPAFICIVVVLGFVGVIVWVWVGWPWDWGHPWTLAAQVYATAMCLLFIWFAGKFAFKRLVFNLHPAEYEKVLKQE